MIRQTLALAAALIAAPALAVGQQPMMQHDQGMRMEHMQQTMAQMDRLMQGMRLVNQQMMQQLAQQHFQGMGQQMEEAGERLQGMLKHLHEMQRDPQMHAPDRMRQMDQLQDRLRKVVDGMQQAHEAFQRLVKP
jgi:hypothetical protein